MNRLLWQIPQLISRRIRITLIVQTLAGCSAISVHGPAPDIAGPTTSTSGLPTDTAPLPAALQQAKSRWVPVH